MNIRMVKDRILVLLPPTQNHPTTASGLITAPALPPPTTHGRVVKVGPDVRDVRPGDMVAFPPTAGDDVQVGAHACLILRERDVHATIERSEVACA